MSHFPSTQSRPTPDASLWQLLASPAIRLTVLIMALGFYGLLIKAAVTTTHHGITVGGAPLFYDFEAFYEAGRMALHGHAAAAYDDTRMIAAEQAAFPGMTVRLPWNYPPSLQLLVAPLALLPYGIAWLVWSTLGYGSFILGLRQLLGKSPPLLLWVAPAAAVNLFFGQNGLLTAALLCSGISLLDSRPRLAGVLLGLMTCKPQFALLLPLLLAADGRWRSVGAAVLSQAMLAGAALWLLGTAPWLGFVDRLAHPASVFNSSSSDWHAIPSMLILARTLGFPTALATAGHWCVALAATITAIWVWRRTTDVGARTAAAGAAILLITPYLRAYDLALLTPAVLGLAADRVTRRGPVDTAVTLLAIALGWLAPLTLMFSTYPLQYGPLVSLLCLGAVAWRLLPGPTDTATRPKSEHGT